MKRSEIVAILASAGLRPQHQFGQNFMIDQNILRAIAEAGDIQPQDIVLEVGPGVGNLTRLLAEKASDGAVLAVDIDRKLLPAAQAHHAQLTNITWLIADVLASKHTLNAEVLSQLRSLRLRHPQGQLKLVSNLPYNAASPLIANLLVQMWQDLKNPPTAQPPLFFSRLAFTVQYEVGQRMRAAPDTADYGALGILIQLTSTVEIVRKIPPGAFWPPPKIHSALVIIEPSREKMERIGDAMALQKLLAGLFSHRRQTLHNALRHYLQENYTPDLTQQITTLGINLKLRPEAITPPQFLTLAKTVQIYTQSRQLTTNN